MIAITYELCALQPLLLTRLEGDPNSSVSYPYVPGSAVRGALATRYMEQRRREEDRQDYDPMGDDAVRRLFFEGTVRYLNAYPLDRDGWRTLPTPLSWFYEKQKGLTSGVEVHDFSVTVPRNLLQPKNVGARFWRRFATETGEEEDEWAKRSVFVEFTDPVWEINVHTLRDRRKGRAIEDGGAVFRYQALAPDSRFGGSILVPEKDAETIETLLQDGDLWLGRSRSAGYGRTAAGSVRRNSAWSEAGTQPADVVPGGRLVLTLLSDAILRRDGDRDEDAIMGQGRNAGGHSDRLLTELLPPPLATALKLEESYKQVVPVGGFNRKWGLPLDQAPALQAGSVFVYRAKAPVSAADLRALEREGVGERRVEGLGRVAANWHRDEKLLVQPVTMTRQPYKPIELAGAEKEVAKGMVRRLLRRNLDRRLGAAISAESSTITGETLSRTQLARLRTLALNALPTGDVPRLLAFLLDANLNRPAREQLHRARIDGERLLDWLAGHLLNALPAPALASLQALLQCLAQEVSSAKCRWSQEQVDDLLKSLAGSTVRLLPAAGAAEVAALLADDEARKRALKEHPEPRIDGVRLVDRIAERLEKPISIWQRLDAEEMLMPHLGKVEAKLSDEMAREYTIRLVEGVLHRAARGETHG